MVRTNPFLLSKNKIRPLILDGAMGSMLQQYKIPNAGNMWMSFANISHPEIVIKIHREYIEAGADIITSNTFRTNPLALQVQPSLKINDVVKRSVEIAKEARANSEILIAGSNAPAEDCYQAARKVSEKEVESNHKKHIDLLYENGCDFILNETHSHFDEIKIICDHCSKNKIPFVMSLFSFDGEKIMSGEKIYDIIQFLKDTDTLAISFNCIMPETFLNIYNELNFDFNWGTYLNCGNGNYTDENISCGISPVDYSNFIKKILKKSPSFIGSCCGSTPEHINEIKKLFDEKYQ